MKYTLFALLVVSAIVCCSGATGPMMIAQENGIDSMTIRSLGVPSLNSNPLPGKEIIKIKEATSLLIDGLAYTVSATIGSKYYVMLAYGSDIFMFGINLDDGSLFIDTYSPNQEQIYVYGLSYDSKSNYLIGLSSLPYSVPSYFDVVEIDQNSGAISKNFSFGEFPAGSVYSGIYAFNQDASELYVVYRQYTNASESTQEGMVVVNTLTGKVSRSFWFTGFQAADMWLYSLVYDPQSQQLIGSTANYVGTNPAFVSISPATGLVTLISSSAEYSGNGPTILPGGIFVSPGHTDISSNTLYYVNITNGELLTKHSSFDVLVEFLALYNA
ncbi:hypothetical protein PPL_10000 [Heterostelium album PN500]|uniref:Uncharacterized protein n=1 Tax=Heterostelium pallidum (strain ATCC 26659 / Pp 5 / PN500) TaxID=670386 RepID=D3BPV6_HETP5|nr:hypothetical protein PPL_10000 [Heterostelium album PN500]EFA76239.1 hypothetical protein PPL_10000 [Heterostelium album PN500]|eukprot:XP_020428372.1 hypothetical protein PPL_10000 [Heterostelium album PN500]